MAPEQQNIWIRKAVPEDAEAISRLIHSLADYFLADPADPESALFFETITPEAILDHISGGDFRYFIAETGVKLVGAIGVRDESHLYHLFVSREHQKRGLASKLWGGAKKDALARSNPGCFTVNSSPYAVPVYEKFGFMATGPEIRKNGLIYIPMVMDIPRQ